MEEINEDQLALFHVTSKYNIPLGEAFIVGHRKKKKKNNNENTVSY